MLNSKFVVIFMLYFLTSAVLYFYSTKHTKEYARIMAIASRGELKMIFLWFTVNITMLEIKIEYYDFRALNLKVSAKR